MTGGGDVDYLVRLGALTDNWVLIHCLQLKDKEIDAVARAGASVVSNPVSNAYSCDGIAPVKQMFARGRERRPRQRRRLRELLDRHGRADEVRRAHPERDPL